MSADSLPSPPSNRIKLLPWFLVTSLILGGVVILAWGIQNQSVTTSEEPSITLADLAAKYSRIPDESNAAIVLLDLWEKEEGEFWTQFRRGEKPTAQKRSEHVVPDIPILGSNAPSRNAPLDPTSLAAGEAYLAQKGAHFEALHEALRRPEARFPLRFEDGYSAWLPHLSNLKREGQMLKLQGMVAGQRGDTPTALRALAEGMKLAELLKSEPFMTSQLFRLALLRMDVEGIEWLLSRQSLTAEPLQELEAILRPVEFHGVLRDVFVAERALAFDFFKSTNSLEMVGPPRGTIGFKVLSVTGILASDRRLIRETFVKAIALAERDDPGMLAEMERLVEKATAAATGFPPRIFSRAILPSFDAAADKFAMTEASLRMARTALAVERYRAENEGRLPENLAALAPRFLSAVPADPFDGHPLRFQRWPAGYLIYSVGVNRIDDGGPAATGLRNPSKAALDQAFIVVR